MESNRKMLKLLLKRNGVEADTAEDGQMAVDIITKDKRKYGIVFMDNQMPVLVLALPSSNWI
jgi:CheY-like chemotaxis protein